MNNIKKKAKSGKRNIKMTIDQVEDYARRHGVKVRYSKHWGKPGHQYSYAKVFEFPNGWVFSIIQDKFSDYTRRYMGTQRSNTFEVLVDDASGDYYAKTWLKNPKGWLKPKQIYDMTRYYLNKK